MCTIVKHMTRKMRECKYKCLSSDVCVLVDYRKGYYILHKELLNVFMKQYKKTIYNNIQKIIKKPNTIVTEFLSIDEAKKEVTKRGYNLHTASIIGGNKNAFN